MNMCMNAASLDTPSTPPPSHLGQHFLEVAEEARADGNEELVIHFIELALEAFDNVLGQDLNTDPDLLGSSAAHESLCG